MPGIDDVNLSIPLLADIYMGKVSRWDDPGLQLINPRVSLPTAKIAPIGRYEQSSDTSDLSAILSIFSAEWNRSYGVFDSPNFRGGICCNSSTWPPAVWLFGSRVNGLIGLLGSIPNTIGFGSGVTLALNNITLATLANRHGNFCPPSTVSAQKAMEFFAHTKPIGDSDITDANDSEAYPIVKYYMINFINLTHTLSMDCCSARELIGFIEFVIEEPSQEMVGLKYRFVPLLSSVKGQIRKQLSQFTCNGEGMYEAYQESLSRTEVTKDSVMQTIILGALGVICLLGLVVGIVFFRKRRETMRKLSTLLLKFEDLKPVKDVRLASSRSVLTIQSNSVGGLAGRPIKLYSFGETHVVGHPMAGVDLSVLKRQSRLQLLHYRDEISHENLLPFVGLAFLNSNECLSVCSFSGGVSLHEFLNADKYQVSNDIRYNFVNDVVQGMKYLHSRLIAHKTLNSINCCLDRGWRVRIAQWHISHFLSFESVKSQQDLLQYRGELLDFDSLVRFLYLDPMVSSSSTFSHFSDVFSFGYLLYEIFTKQLPFEAVVELQEEPFEEFLRRKLINLEKLCLEIPSDVPKPIQLLITKCQSLDQRERPTFKQIEAELLRTNCKAKKGVIDLLMDAVETYVVGLEDAVAVRTAAALDINGKLTALLSEVLPAGISTRLLNGEQVIPESFECVSVLFCGEILLLIYQNRKIGVHQRYYDFKELIVLIFCAWIPAPWR